MKKKLTFSIIFLAVIGMFMFTGCNRDCEYEGVWLFQEMYVDGELFSDEPGGFVVAVDEEGEWTIIDNASHDNGSITSKDGKDCIIYNDYIYYLELDEENLILNVDGSNVENVEQKEGKLTINVDKGTDNGKIVLKKVG